MKIAILGTGAYGLALATAFHDNSNEVSMWTKFEDEYNMLIGTRANERVLPGIKIPDDIKIELDMQKCIENAAVIVIAVPSNTIRSVAKSLKECISNDQCLCIASKGMENATDKFMSQVVLEEINTDKLCVLSGPSFAIEVANKAVFGLTVASENGAVCDTIRKAIESENIVVDITDDMIGVQVCASVKNIFAIILGMLDESKNSTKATMLTILFKDLKNINVALGGSDKTVYTYAGIGDLLLTCTSSKSRNYSFGKYIYQNMTPDQAFEKMGTKTVEGIAALKSIKALLDKRYIDVCSIDTLYDILYNNRPANNIFKCIK